MSILQGVYVLFKFVWDSIVYSYACTVRSYGCFFVGTFCSVAIRWPGCVDYIRNSKEMFYEEVCYILPTSIMINDQLCVQ